MAQSELIRIYTPLGVPTEHFKTRGQIHRDGDWHATVHLWVLNAQGELLFQKRSDEAEIHPGLWDISAAGHVVGADSFELSLEREAFEELGMQIDAGEAKFLFSVTAEIVTPSLNERVFQYVYLIEKDIDCTALTLQKEEVAETRWHHFSILDTLAQDAGAYVPRFEEYRRLAEYLHSYLMV